MSLQPEGQSGNAEFENYKLWLARIREERGTVGVAEATFRLYTENKRLRAEVERLQRGQTKRVIMPTDVAVQRSVSPGRLVQLEEGAKTRAAIYNFLVSYFNEHKQAPSYREIAAAVGRSNVIVGRHLQRLEADGKITREPGVERGIQLV